MSKIIAGRFETQELGLQALEALQSAGFRRDGLAIFYVNPAGQHDVYPIGGDGDDSPGARGAGGAAAAGGGAGALAGAAIGLAAGPVGALAGAGVGAYAGSLAGAMQGTNADSEADEERAAGEPRKVTERHSGVHVAVRVDSDSDEPRSRAIRTLQANGAVEVEYARGQIVDGNWSDFDAREAVKLV